MVGLILSFICGTYLMGLHHEAIHRKGKLYWITSILTSSWYLRKFHTIHHKFFLKGIDDFSWAKKGESFYSFFVRTQIRRRQIIDKKWVLLDLLTFFIMTYLFGWYYVIMVIGYTFHWELFEYWSHYALKDITQNEYWWSWNVIGKPFNIITLNTGFHSNHHKKGKGYFPVVYSRYLYEAYLPLVPSKFYKFMDKQIEINKSKGILK